MTYTIILEGTVVALYDSWEGAETAARKLGPDALIECPEGTVLEFCFGWYRKVGERSELFKACKSAVEESHEWTVDEILAREA